MKDDFFLRLGFFSDLRLDSPIVKYILNFLYLQLFTKTNISLYNGVTYY